MRVLPGSVNSSVSLVGYDLGQRALPVLPRDFPPRCLLPKEYAD